MKRLIITALLCSSILGCQTTESSLKRKMHAVSIPEFDCQQADVVDVIDFLVGAACAYDKPSETDHVALSLSLNLAKDRSEQAKHDRRYAKLRQYCGDKKITINIRNCPVINLLDFVTRYASVKYEFDNNHITFKTLDGQTLIIQ